MLLSTFPDYDLDLMFGDDKEARNAFGDFLVNLEEQYERDEDEILFNGTNIYEEKIEKIRSKKVDSIDSAIIQINKINKLNKKMKKNAKYSYKQKSRDLSIASYLNDKKYKKKFLDKKKYRKYMSNIAKAEKKELKEMKKLGYIHNTPDDELNRLKIDKVNEQMLNALSDAYAQKHFI